MATDDRIDTVTEQKTNSEHLEQGTFQALGPLKASSLEAPSQGLIFK